MLELFMFGTLWFWSLLGLTLVLIIYYLENENYGGTGATITVVIFSVLVWFFGGREVIKEVFSYINNNPDRFVWLLLGYMGIGLAWSFIKWYFYLLGTKERLQKRIDNEQSVYESDIPAAKDNKGKIISWMTYWPLSSLWTLINDPFKRAFKFIYGRFEILFEMMSAKMFSDMKSKMK